MLLKAVVIKAGGTEILSELVLSVAQQGQINITHGDEGLRLEFVEAQPQFEGSGD